MRSPARTSLLATAGIALFWAGVFTAGALVDGYSAQRDYISSLASRGSPVAALGVAALTASAAAHLITAWLVLRSGRSRVLATAIGLSGLATLVVAAFRSSCPSGPAGCGIDVPGGSDTIEAIHGAGVGIYELFTLVAMLVIAVDALRRRRRWPRWLGVASLVFAVASVYLIGRTAGDDIGLWQRLWIANNQTWLLVVAWTTASLADGGGHSRTTSHKP